MDHDNNGFDGYIQVLLLSTKFYPMKILNENGKAYLANPAASEFDRFLKDNSLKSPGDFYEFYRQYNGWKISNPDLQLVYEFSKPFGERDKLDISCLLPVDTLFFNYSQRAGVAIPEGTIPFIEAQEGEILISFRHDSFGKIYFCEENPTLAQVPENEFESEIAKFDPSTGQIPGMLKCIANSFTEFVNMLVIREW